ncbi:MAG: AAA family ATPase [Proteobacteria bacterium]|nr:AAA family ATPase [Pseudomonadota bacterium]
MQFKKHMKHLEHAGSVSCDPDKNERFVLRNCAVYLDRLLGAAPLADRETIKLLAWVMGPEMIDLGQILLERMSSKEKQKYEQDIEENILDPDEAPDSICRILRQSGKKRTTSLINAVRNLLARRYKALAYAGRSDTEKKLVVLAKMFSLSEQEKVLVEFLYIISAWQQGEDYFVDHLRCQDISGRRYLKMILQMTDREMTDALSGTLMRIEFYEMEKHTFAISDDFLAYFQKPSNELLAKNYFVRFSRKTIPLENHLIDPKVTDHLLSLLKVKRESPNHILLYGPPGTGKTSYALGLAQKLGIPAYEILREEDNTTSKRRAAILACLNMTNGGDGSLVIVDEGDNLLNTQNSWFSRGETQDKGWLNQLLEEPGARMIWITNSISDIEDSVMRRFAFSVHFRAFNRRQRLSLWESVLRRHRVKSCFNSKEISGLVMRYPVSAGIIDLSIRKALETSKSGQVAFKEIVTMNLDAHITLINDGVKPQAKEKIEENYSIDGLHVEGDLPAIMEHLEEFDRCLRRPDQRAIRNFNLLFYGPPGAGKSELARYIAGHLDRELMVKRVSDVVSPYVGETEQNISRAFSEAEDAEAVLVIDEADSFLFSRSRAIRSWEISHTNEFLTQMERFRGILICTTNRFEDLDQASVRRFNYKIGFRCLKPEGNVIFYKKMLSPLTEIPLNKEGEDMLETIGDLTPGDFRVVRDRFTIFPPERVTHVMMVQALREESQIKKLQEGKKPLGFMRPNS